MHTISMLRRALGLSSDNQVRNRIERIKDLVAEHIRRGPNNQIFLTDAGLDLLKQLQELYDTGLTLAEASHVLRAKNYNTDINMAPVSAGLASNQVKPVRSPDGRDALAHELKQLRQQLSALERQLTEREALAEQRSETAPWWARLREDVDVT